MSTILYGNQMEKALEKALEKIGFEFESTHKVKKPRHKKFICKVCGSPMIVIENTNTMACSNEKCGNYYIFDGNNEN